MQTNNIDFSTYQPPVSGDLAAYNFLEAAYNHPIFNPSYVEFFKSQGEASVSKKTPAIHFTATELSLALDLKPEFCDNALFQEIYKTQIAISEFFLKQLEELSLRSSVQPLYPNLAPSASILEKTLRLCFQQNFYEHRLNHQLKPSYSLLDFYRTPAATPPADLFAQMDTDGSHLLDWSEWKAKLAVKLQGIEPKELILTKIEELQKDLESSPLAQKAAERKIFIEGAEHTYLRGITLTQSNPYATSNTATESIGLTFLQRKNLEVCFVATCIRSLLLNDNKTADFPAKRLAFLEKFSGKYQPCMKGFIDADEFAFLYRFERAAQLFSDLNLIDPKRNRGLFLDTVTLLEGSNLYADVTPKWETSLAKKRRELLAYQLIGLKNNEGKRKLETAASNPDQDPPASLPGRFTLEKSLSYRKYAYGMQQEYFRDSEAFLQLDSADIHHFRDCLLEKKDLASLAPLELKLLDLEKKYIEKREMNSLEISVEERAQINRTREMLANLQSHLETILEDVSAEESLAQKNG